MATILAIETSSEMASCALLRGERVYFRESSGVRTHSQAVLPMIQELLAEAGIVLRDCDAIAYGAGPVPLPACALPAASPRGWDLAPACRCCRW